ncbi:hypothetical protein LJB71_06915 [Thermomonas sp. S9]|uniref:hypothetical protein n=1 Tax=Thermomonas sp. S9 TaxID=2885203 RepID=UPI00216AD1DC|nr:hypothetical protein [Thermomonas sp. S9]MCR6495976.1 hypothetical protein [Thermomonas sp. S9]
MNRKLHNSLMAALASSALFVIALLASTPATSSAPASLAQDAPLQDAALAGLAPALDAPAARTGTRPLRQSVRMPFFSFAPRS